MEGEIERTEHETWIIKFKDAPAIRLNDSHEWIAEYAYQKGLSDAKANTKLTSP